VPGARGGLRRWRGLIRRATTPSKPFDAGRAPPAPDYAKRSSWAALPKRASQAAALRHSLAGDGASRASRPEAGADPAADTFFVHPTTHFWCTHWNAPIDGWLTRAITATALAGQASAFDGVTRVYAPRYRQMTLAGFAHEVVRKSALELAYADVRRAFRHYLAEWSDGRPLILAGHSQGSRHVLRLLDEFFREEPLRRRLVAAYAVGTPVWSGAYERGEAAIPIGERPDQTGCLISWCTYSEGVDPRIEPEDGERLCVNPLHWRTDDVAVPASANLGSIPLPMLRGPRAPRPGVTGARCADGLVRVDPISLYGFRWFHAGGDWHAYDFALFYASVRENAKLRVSAFLRNRG
jgi:hypothetical protein